MPTEEDETKGRKKTKSMLLLDVLRWKRTKEGD